MFRVIFIVRTWTYYNEFSCTAKSTPAQIILSRLIF